MIDTHSHIYCEEFDADRDEVIARAREAGVEAFLLPAIDSESHERLLTVAAAHADHYPMMGLHPTSVADRATNEREMALVERYFADPDHPFVAVGEVGIDLYWSSEHRGEQMEIFARQVELSLRHDLPLAIHVRNAWSEVLEVLDGYRGRGVRGIFHAFAAECEVWRAAREMGDMLFGIGGVVTYKKSLLPEVVAQMGLEEMVLETDAPYLPPVPYRGKRNESSYLQYTCAKVAEIKGVTPAEVSAQTTANVRRMFRIE